MKTKYLEFISESRYKTHGLKTVKRTLPKFLKSIKCDFKIEYNEPSDDFAIYFTNLTNGSLDVIISRCELLGYYPSVLTVDDKEKNNNIKSIDEFVDFVKQYKLNDINKVYVQFESWLDGKVETPESLYHVCRTIDSEKIERYGVSPRSKHKISFHPDRIYLVDDYLAAIAIIKQFKKIEDIAYSIVKITPNRNELLLRNDPNFDAGFYTTQNILPIWINNIKEINL